MMLFSIIPVTFLAIVAMLPSAMMEDDANDIRQPSTLPTKRSRSSSSAMVNDNVHLLSEIESFSSKIVDNNRENDPTPIDVDEKFEFRTSPEITDRKEMANTWSTESSRSGKGFIYHHRDDDTALETSAKDNIKMIFSVLLAVGLLIGLIIAIVVDHQTGKNKQEPEEQINLILCMAENAAYEYNLIFRVGCPSYGFDMKHSYIDYEILGPNDGIVGTPVRFDCSLLPDPICGEMHCLIGRITPMPHIEGIRANHSGKPDEFIFFYEFELIDLKTDETLDRRLVLENIESRARVFRGLAPNDPAAGGKGPTSSGNLNDVLPRIPVVDLTLVETAIQVVWTVLLCGMLCALFEYHNWYAAGKTEQGSLYRSLQDAAFVSPIVLVFLFLNLFVFKYNIKRIALQQEYAVNLKIEWFWIYLNKVYLMVIVHSSMVFAIIVLVYNYKMAYILSLYWFSSTTLTTVLVLGIWSCCNQCSVMTTIYSQYGDDLNDLNESKMAGFMVGRYVSALNTDRTVYFSKLKAVEPELVNPRRGLTERRRLKNRKRATTSFIV